MNHLIQQQRLDIVWNGPEHEALAFQHRLSDWATATLMPAVARVLDACLPAHTYLRIEKLEINIDDIKTANWEAILPQKIVEAIAAAISDKLHAAQQSTTSDTTLKTTTQRITEAFVYFLQTGLLPWHYPTAEAADWEAALPLLFAQPAAKDAIQDILQISVARERLVTQFSGVFLGTLLAQLHAPSAHQFNAFLGAFEKISSPISKSSKEHIIREVWLEIWATIGHKEPVEIAEILQKIIPQLPQETPQPFGQWAAFFAPILKATNLPEQLMEAVEFEIDLKTNSTSLSSKASFKNNEAQPLPPSEIYLANAGIVLLHPFLPQFFEGILCAADEQLVCPDKAALALHFFATGQWQTGEYELTLAKILCGIPLAKTIPLATDWDIHDTEEAEAVLHAVVKYWEALKDSSIGLLRAEFLQRNGKLSPRQDGWLLQVERRDFDFLLDQLPWGFSTIKLPWMKEFLYVEWI